MLSRVKVGKDENIGHVLHGQAVAERLLAHHLHNKAAFTHARYNEARFVGAQIVVVVALTFFWATVLASWKHQFP